METWEEMTFRHSEEKAQIEKQQEHERFQLKLSDTADAMDALMLEERIKQENKALIAQHYNEAKAHPESPDLDDKWDEYFRPKNLLTMDEFMAQQKTEQQKSEDQLKEAAFKQKSSFELLQEQQQRNLLGLDPER